jgi:hypothetical protein
LNGRAVAAAGESASVNVFAYGSNLSRRRIETRIGPVEVVAVARLDGHCLRFHKRGRDGTGKADAFFTDDQGDRVWGVVYAMSHTAKCELDRIEGVGQGYRSVEARLTTSEGKPLTAWVYLAEPGWIDPSLVPAAWYRDLVVAGAREQALPADYVADLVARGGPTGGGARSR